MNTANIGQKALTCKDTNCVTVKNDRPLFPSESDTITQLPNLNTARKVELDNATAELTHLEHLGEEQRSDRPTLAHHLQLVEGGLVKIHAPKNSKINGRLGRIAKVHESTVEVWLRDVNTITMHKYILKHNAVESVPSETEPQLVQVGNRISTLRKCNLDPFEIEILLLLERAVVFTPLELEYLSHIEQRWGNKAL